MKKFGSVDEILDFAIKEEEEAFNFYTDLAKKMDKPWMKEVFLEFAGEEKGHKEKLLGIKKDKSLVPSAEEITDLKIGDYLVDVDSNQELDYQKALILAMKKEKAAFKLYTNLAAKAGSSDLKRTFQALAQEEAKHKLRFEIEYDDHILTCN